MDSLADLPFPPRKSSLPSPPRPVASSRPTRPANLNFSSLLSFGRQQGSTSPTVKRKPLPSDSPVLANNKFGSSEHDQKLNPPSTAASSDASSPLLLRDLDQFPRGQSPLLPSRSSHRKPVNVAKQAPSSSDAPELPLNSPTHSRGLSAPPGGMPTICEQESVMGKRTSQASTLNSRPPPLKIKSPDRPPSHESTESKQPRTPGSKITQFFNWRRTASPGDDSSSTEPSDHGLSPVPSPLAPSPQTSRYSARSFPHGLDAYKGDPAGGGDYASRSMDPSLVDQDLADKVGQVEGELREISCELAGSIKREMELEDLVERLQVEASGPNDETRTSDYYSDSSTGSARLAVLEASLKLEDFEKAKRQAEQERARLKVEFSQKWQEETGRRRVLETHVQSLESQISETGLAQVDSSRLSARHKELEASLEDTRRGLAGERQIKESFEAQLNALRAEIESDRTERNRLRDEVVPQLQAKLLSKNIDPSPPAFDSARMQQEIQALKHENAALKETRRSQQDAQHSQPRFNAISEEDEGPTCLSPRSPPIGVGRSNSVARAPGRSPGLSTRSGSLSRSNSTGGKSPIEPRETLAERMKDVEFQRDALHSAMKALLARQECQSKEYEKQIRTLEQERDRAGLPPTPRRLGYEKEVKNLRGEINQLRRRADDALTQKMQCEKGLGGLKMDLDRSEQETSTLRKLLKEHDIALPDDLCDSLQHAYDDLQRDRSDAAALMEEDPGSRTVEEEQRLAEQLRQSAERSEGLARQMTEQVATNQALRDRLAHAIGRGERNQTASTGQITDLETKLRALEETVTTAQQKSEAGVVAHEEEIRILEEAHSAQLHRLRAAGSRSPSSPAGSGKRGLSPLVSPIFSQRTPRLDQTTSGQGMRLDQAVKTAQLEKKVAELEAALESTDQEMQEVVGRMNAAQIEAMQLQTERDEVLKQTRKLETAISTEREQVRSLINRSKNR